MPLLSDFTKHSNKLTPQQTLNMVDKTYPLDQIVKIWKSRLN